MKSTHHRAVMFTVAYIEEKREIGFVNGLINSDTWKIYIVKQVSYANCILTVN